MIHQGKHRVLVAVLVPPWFFLAFYFNLIIIMLKKCVVFITLLIFFIYNSVCEGGNIFGNTSSTKYLLN